MHTLHIRARSMARLALTAHTIPLFLDALRAPMSRAFPPVKSGKPHSFLFRIARYICRLGTHRTHRIRSMARSAHRTHHTTISRRSQGSHFTGLPPYKERQIVPSRLLSAPSNTHNVTILRVLPLVIAANRTHCFFYTAIFWSVAG